jgi:hypothetical protein
MYFDCHHPLTNVSSSGNRAAATLHITVPPEYSESLIQVCSKQVAAIEFMSEIGSLDLNVRI